MIILHALWCWRTIGSVIVTLGLWQMWSRLEGLKRGARDVPLYIIASRGAIILEKYNSNRIKRFGTRSSAGAAVYIYYIHARTYIIIQQRTTTTSTTTPSVHIDFCQVITVLLLSFNNDGDRIGRPICSVYYNNII